MASVGALLMAAVLPPVAALLVAMAVRVASHLILWESGSGALFSCADSARL
ncbi:hypothetical protein TRIUR3_13448 [Triticum urartu]|uniref:Uncharacterized protein n=1 Tax=Triticum urartu TaxID=4572 RepID=M8AIA8_TRIUA|nr:hypothetical protein TRIUR3_13448 [Triticum urartu]